MTNLRSAYPALGVLELTSIATGIATCDAIVKKADVRIIRSETTHPGKYLIVFRGGVEEVNESMRAGLNVGRRALIDHVVLPNPHERLESVFESPTAYVAGSVGIIEAYSLAGIIRAADAVLKMAETTALKIRLGDHIGGKGYFIFCGELHDVEFAMAAGQEALGDGLLISTEIIANPHEDLVIAL